MIKRFNSFNQVYNLFSIKDNKTKIICGNKSIIVDFPLSVIEDMWTNWQLGGLLIQYAFPEFTSAEREFLMTGITPKEWDETFKDL